MAWLIVRLSLLVLIAVLAASRAEAAPAARIIRDHWTPQDEAGFADFVQKIGDSGCGSARACLDSPANPLRAPGDGAMGAIVDCAKLPYVLRAYYALRNGLPFGYVSEVSGDGRDLRYTRAANRVRARTSLTDDGDGIPVRAAIAQLLDSVWSATYRTDAATDGAAGINAPASDFYAPAIGPASIRPGTVIYDPNGHVGIVYRVDPDGRIRYMDAHPDHTISHSVYGAQFGQSSARLGGGLKNWRPLRLIGARFVAGRFIGGRVIPDANAAIPDFSMVQYIGTEPNPDGPQPNNPRAARFAYNNQPLGFYEYVRVAMSGGRTDFNPVYELQSTVATLCNDLGDRAQFVNLALDARIQDRAHPARLPDNIYGTEDGDWETYSTPSRDGRLKAAFAQFHADLSRMIALWAARDPRVVYDGVDLKSDLGNAYRKASSACAIRYVNSNGGAVTLDFDTVQRRLFALSFDPYHCAELRWGASGDERASCPDNAAKRDWYAAEQRLRNQPDRVYDATMNYALADLQAGRDAGLNAPPPTDIAALIAAIPPRAPFAGMAAVGH